MAQNQLQEFDNHKLQYHPEQVGDWLKHQKTYPIYVEIAPTAACNYKCIFCAFDYSERTSVFIDLAFYKKIINELASLKVKSVMLAGEGEPMLHKNICDMVSHTKKQGIDISITTNGSVMDKLDFDDFSPYLSWIRVSLNAASKDTYTKIHKAHESIFDKVLNGLKKITEHKKKNNLNMTIGVQFLLIPENARELEEIAKISRDLGVDYLSIKPYSHHPKSINNFDIDYNAFNEEHQKIMRYATQDFKILYRKNAMKTLEEKKRYCHCHGLNFFSLIDARGNVIPCNVFFDSNETFTFGNLHKNTFKEIWNSQKRKDVMGRINADIDKNCRLGCRLEAINDYLDRLINPLPHDNFI